MLCFWVVISHIVPLFLWKEREDVSSYGISLEYHEKCRDDHDHPESYSSTNLSDDRESSWSECAYLTGKKCLDISCILLDHIECMVDIGFTEEEEDTSFYVRMEVKSMDSLTGIYFFCFERPVAHSIYDITDIVHYDRHECPYDDTPEEEYDNEDESERHPCRYLVLLSEVHERIHHDRQKYRYDNDKYDISEGIEKISEDGYTDQDAYFPHPERDILIHSKKIITPL